MICSSNIPIFFSSLQRWKKQQKDNEKKRSQGFKKRAADRKTKADAMAVDDERFKQVDASSFLGKPTRVKVKGEKDAVPGLVKPKFQLKKSKVDKKLLVPRKKDEKVKRKIKN